jgi:hypothetical protein
VPSAGARNSLRRYLGWIRRLSLGNPHSGPGQVSLHASAVAPYVGLVIWLTY